MAFYTLRQIVKFTACTTALGLISSLPLMGAKVLAQPIQLSVGLIRVYEGGPCQAYGLANGTYFVGAFDIVNNKAHCIQGNSVAPTGNFLDTDVCWIDLNDGSTPVGGSLANTAITACEAYGVLFNPGGDSLPKDFQDGPTLDDAQADLSIGTQRNLQNRQRNQRGRRFPKGL